MSLPPAGGGASGEYSYRQLEQLWLSAGGRRTLAPTMAAIAEAESGGNPTARNPSGAEGLWQILGAVNPHDQAHLYNPGTNAHEAVLKWKTQGLSAWQTYTSGAYRKFMQGGRPAPQEGVTSGSAFVKEAEKFTGTPYVWGGSSPGGFDCSGLVQYALQQVGLKNVPRTSQQQYKWVAHISRAQLRPGDLVFYAGSDGTNAAPGHVGIYVGSNQVLQAPETGMDVGRHPIDWAGKPVGYGRVPGLTGVIGGSNPGGGGGNVPNPWLQGLENFLGFGPPGSQPGGAPPVGQAFTTAEGLTGIADSLANFENRIAWLFVPAHWLRIVCFLLGVPLVGIGIVTMTKGAQPIPISAYGVSTQVSMGSLSPAIGIAEVTLGCIALFVAFHNLDADGVHNFPTLVSYLQGSLQRQGAQPVKGGG